MVLKRFFRFKTTEVETRSWFVEPDVRIYAIGDIHGRADLLENLIKRIEADDAVRPNAATSLIFLGDLIDRGPDSRHVVERIMAMCAASPQCICLQGNHEQLLIKAWDGDRTVLPTFHRAGARATMLSYGVDPDEYDRWDFDELQRQIRTHIPEAHAEFLRTLPPYHQNGDYLFVHAGIRPGVSIPEQRSDDMKWIREEFIASQHDHGVMVVHGHSIRPQVDIRPNRIGIDTGAYKSDVLTAIGIEADQCWFLST